jgi:beta-catenin-like protein 1
LAEKIGQDTSVLTWLLDRIPKKESPVSQNKQYAAEVMAILLQSSPLNRRKLCELDGVDLLLQILSAYRKRDPLKGTEEEEFVENVFDSLTCLVDEPEGKQKFVEAEGIELCLIMIKEGKMSKPRALRLIDHALNGQSGSEVCERLVEAAGLKVVFGMFMKKQDGQTTEHLLGIFSSLLRLLPANSSGRIRTLAKFVEKDYEKLVKLVKLRRDYAARVAVVDNEIRNEQAKMDAEEREDMADEWDSRRLDAGLFCLQTIDVILAWLVAEDDGASKRIQTLLADRDESLAVIKATIQGKFSSISHWTKSG